MKDYLKKCKDCKYLSIHTDIDGYKTGLYFCRHPKNKNKYEGNITDEDCPLLNKKEPKEK